MPVRHDDPLGRIEGESRPEQAARRQQAEDRVDVALVRQHNLVRVRRVHEDVPHVQPVERELHFGSDPEALDAQRKSRLSSGDVTEGGARVLLRLGGFEDDRDLGARVRPDVALHRLELEDVVVKNHRVIVHQLKSKSWKS